MGSVGRGGCNERTTAQLGHRARRRREMPAPERDRRGGGHRCSGRAIHGHRPGAHGLLRRGSGIPDDRVLNIRRVRAVHGRRHDARPRRPACGSSNSFENLGWFSYAYHYRINSSIPSIPGNAHGQILSGHHVWNNTTNPCGYADLTSFTAYSDGNTTAHGGSNDGVNVVDFGSMSGGFSSCNTAGILACTLFWTTSSYMTGADIRFNSSVAWYATSGAPPSGYYDVYSTATHESGHALGLGHTSGGSTNYLTMYPFQCSGCIRERDLGRGDVNGLRALYP